LVKVAQVLQRDVPLFIEVIGETRGNTETEIRARVEGFIESVEFKQGSLVKKGDLLYTLDRRPFEAALAQAKASHAVAEAERARAHQDVARYEPLVSKNAVSREQYETAVAVEKAAVAAVEAAKALVDRAEIDLSYTKVLAPEDGLIGKTEVYTGTLVGRGQSTLLARISRIDPIHARITVPERSYLELSRRRGPAHEADKSQAKFELLLADGSVHPHPGAFVFVDRNVDPRTGTILIEVAFPNPEQLVRPGQYARVRVQTDVAKDAILVPQRAVQELQGVYSVTVVGADGRIQIRQVKPAERVGPLWRIAIGLKSDERIVVEGLQRARPGLAVNAITVELGEDGRPSSQQASAPSTLPGQQR
jgi:membrane fusion protein (multidrug efflux system)